jgi:type I site-specific restriction-modification system R (restriction) subunit
MSRTSLIKAHFQSGRTKESTKEFLKEHEDKIFEAKIVENGYVRFIDSIKSRFEFPYELENDDYMTEGTEIRLTFEDVYFMYELEIESDQERLVDKLKKDVIRKFDNELKLIRDSNRTDEIKSYMIKNIVKSGTDDMIKDFFGTTDREIMIRKIRDTLQLDNTYDEDDADCIASCIFDYV